MQQLHEPGTDALALDIGGEVGALVVYTDEDLVGCEIEVSPLDDLRCRVHTVVHRRRANGMDTYAGVFVALAAGKYRLWGQGIQPDTELRIMGGEVAEIGSLPADRSVQQRRQ
jgi:hypothetical protein